MILRPQITTLVEVVREPGGALGHRATGSTFDLDAADTAALVRAAGVLAGTLDARGVACCLVVRGEHVVARYDLDALRLAGRLLRALACGVADRRAA